MTTTANLATRLEGILGASRILCGPDELLAYAVDGCVPGAAVQPESAEEVAEIVRFALGEKLAVIASGSRSKLEIGAPPERYDIAVDVTRMAGIAHYDAGDLTLSVDAGMPLRQLEQTLAEKRQFLPLAVPCYESSTIGGAIASGIDSVLRQQYGTARDFLIGAEFVDGTGNLCKSGGRVVKNVTGYDFHKLLIGSLGTLGVITRLNFRTFPMAGASGGHVARFRNAEGAFQYREALVAADLPLGNLEVLSPEIAAIIGGILQRAQVSVSQAVSAEGWSVYAAYEGNDAVVKRIGTELEKYAREKQAAESDLLTGTQDEALGGMLREAYEWLRFSAPAVMILRVALTRPRAESFATLAEFAKQNALRHALLVRGAGIAYFVLQADGEDAQSLQQLEVAAKQVATAVSAQRGSATLLHAPLALKSRMQVWGGDSGNAGLMKRVKQAFDPQNIFAPGRFVGGL